MEINYKKMILKIVIFANQFPVVLQKIATVEKKITKLKLFRNTNFDLLLTFHQQLAA